MLQKVARYLSIRDCQQKKNTVKYRLIAYESFKNFYICKKER